MGIAVSHSSDRETMTISVEGRFDFSTHENFRRAFEGSERPAHCVVDLQKAEYLDSSALGMLLVLREHLGSAAKISLVNARRPVLDVLMIANFHRLFDVV